MIDGTEEVSIRFPNDAAAVREIIHRDPIAKAIVDIHTQKSEIEPEELIDALPGKRLRVTTAELGLVGSDRPPESEYVEVTITGTYNGDSNE